MERKRVTANRVPSLVQPLWHVSEMQDDLYAIYGPRHNLDTISTCKQALIGSAEQRHAIFADKMQKEIKTSALEPGLPTVVR